MEAKANSPLKNIFISYRERDTAGETGRLADTLKQYFSADQIFMDIDKLEPGVDFTEVISSSLDSCDVMLAVIGPDWEGINPVTKTSRIKDPNDWVALEISTALKRKIRVVPILVNGGKLPASADLPEELQPLLRRQAYEISNKRWSYDTQQLAGFLEKSIGIIPKGKEDTSPKNIVIPPPSPPPIENISSNKKKWAVVIAAFIIALSAAGYFIINGNSTEPDKISNNTTIIDSTKDTDTDGVPDYRDKELITSGGVSVDKDGIGQPKDTNEVVVTKDSDKDGVTDDIDKEVYTSKKCFPVDKDGVGKCPEPSQVEPAKDSDGDGIVDTKDRELYTSRNCFPTDDYGVGKCPPEPVKDGDADGVPDESDKEPSTKKECLPADKDGIGKCPDVSVPSTSGGTTSGGTIKAKSDFLRLKRDTDGDGVFDEWDKELNTPKNCFPVDKAGVGKCPKSSLILKKQVTKYQQR